MEQSPRKLTPFTNAQGVPYVQSTTVTPYTLRNGVDFGNISPRLREFTQHLAQAGVVPSFEITSGYRDPQRNAAAGGAKGSRHMQGDAIDISTRGWDDATRAKFLGAAVANGARGVGIYPDGSLHFDLRETPAAWGPNGYSGSGVETFPAWAQPHISAVLGQKPTQVAAAAPKPAMAAGTGAPALNIDPAAASSAPVAPDSGPEPALVALSGGDSGLGNAFASLANQFARPQSAVQRPVAVEDGPRMVRPTGFDASRLFANLQGPLVGRVVA